MKDLNPLPDRLARPCEIGTPTQIAAQTADPTIARAWNGATTLMARATLHSAGASSVRPAQAARAAISSRTEAATISARDAANPVNPASAGRGFEAVRRSDLASARTGRAVRSSFVLAPRHADLNASGRRRFEAVRLARSGKGREGLAACSRDGLRPCSASDPNLAPVKCAEVRKSGGSTASSSPDQDSTTQKERPVSPVREPVHISTTSAVRLSDEKVLVFGMSDSRSSEARKGRSFGGNRGRGRATAIVQALPNKTGAASMIDGTARKVRAKWALAQAALAPWNSPTALSTVGNASAAIKDRDAPKRVRRGPKASANSSMALAALSRRARRKRGSVASAKIAVRRKTGAFPCFLLTFTSAGGTAR